MRKRNVCINLLIFLILGFVFQGTYAHEGV